MARAFCRASPPLRKQASSKARSLVVADSPPDAGGIGGNGSLIPTKRAPRLGRNAGPFRLVREPPPFNLRLTNARIHVRRRKAAGSIPKRPTRAG
jgi:hypothetical protein